MEVKFYNYSKRRNSTAHPTSLDSATVFQVTLKDSSGVLHPVLELNNGASWNPSALNYAYIATYNRYYWIDEWTYIGGRWEATLSVDPLASWKEQIGNSRHYVLRCAGINNPAVVDTLYPSTGGDPYYVKSTADFHFSADLANCCYVLGVANRYSSGYSAVTYYTMTAAQIRSMMQYMLVQSTDLWTQGFTGMTDTLYRAIYSPFDYIKSCKAFPVAYSALSTVPVMFGNYTTDVNGGLVSSQAEGGWFAETHDLSLPANWTSLDAKYRANPYAHLYIHFSPWGMIELNPLDFADASAVRIRCSMDLVSGDGILWIYKVVGSDQYFITQKIQKIAMDINLSSASVNAGGILAGLTTAAGAASALISGGVTMSEGALTAAGGAMSAAMASVPTASGGVGSTAQGFATYDGIASLIYMCTAFTADDPNELGYPYMQRSLISALHTGNNPVGYVKCAEGEVNCAAMPEELDAIEEHLTTGFFYE